VPNHADDGRLLVRIGKVKNLSERVRVAEELVSKVFIDHSNRRRFLAISVGDEAAAYEGDAHDLQIIRLNHVTQSPVHVVFVGGFGSFCSQKSSSSSSPVMGTEPSTNETALIPETPAMRRSTS